MVQEVEAVGRYQELRQEALETHHQHLLVKEIAVETHILQINSGHQVVVAAQAHPAVMAEMLRTADQVVMEPHHL